MSEFAKSHFNKVIRGSKRALYNEAEIYSILDSHFLCQVPYIYEGTAIVVPTAYGRKGNLLFIHGSLKNRMMLSLLGQQKVSLTVTHLDGLVLARSVFHHSANYRSAVIFGRPFEITERQQKLEALEVITDHMIPGRWEEARQPNEKELNSTLVIGIEIQEASAKVRAEGAIDELDDHKLEVWAGVVPLKVIVEKAIRNTDCNESIPTPQSVTNFSF